MTTPHTNCPSCGGPLDRTATECNRCGTPIVKSGGEQTSQAFQNFASAGSEMKSTTAALWVNLSIPLSCFLCIFAWPLIPIIVYFSKKDDPFVLAHLKSSTNFAITMMIPAFIGGLLSFIGIGILILVAVVLVEVVYGIKGSQAASRGELYKYPLAIQIFN